MSLNLACILETSARRCGNEPAVLYRPPAGGDVRVTYGGLREGARRVASAVAGVGVRLGGRGARRVPRHTPLAPRRRERAAGKATRPRCTAHPPAATSA